MFLIRDILSAFYLFCLNSKLNSLFLRGLVFNLDLDKFWSDNKRETPKTITQKMTDVVVAEEKLSKK